MEEIPKYTTIIHKVRIKLDLTCNEYCVADIIYHLSNNPSAKVSGWCYASKETIGNYMGLAKKNIHLIINKLIEKNIIIKDEQTRWLKTTSLWYENVIIEKMKFNNEESLPIVTKGYYGQERKVTPHSNESLHNNNIYNNINNSIVTTEKNYTDQDEQLTNLLYEKVKENYSFLIDNKTDNQKIDDYEEMNRINRIDKKDYKLIKAVILWCQQDSFWRKNIRSVQKLRKQFDNLMIRVYEKKKEENGSSIAVIRPPR